MKYITNTAVSAVPFGTAVNNMLISNITKERLCKTFSILDSEDMQNKEFVFSKDIAVEIGSTDISVRKDISFIGGAKYTRRGYNVERLKQHIGKKLGLYKNRKACIVGLGRLGAALLDYEKFQDDGFQIVAGFDSNINKIERIQTDIEVFPINEMEEVIRARKIELGIIAVPAAGAQAVADALVRSGIRGILNFTPITVSLPKNIVRQNIDFTNALRFLSSQL